MVCSMTAFARQTGKGDWGEAVWELRSVNHRYLDISMRLPEELKGMEPDVRERIGRSISRGKVDCQLHYEYFGDPSSGLDVDEVLVRQLAKTMTELNRLFPEVAPANAIDLLRWPGVIKPPGLDTVAEPLLELLDTAMTAFIVDRRREGDELAGGIEERCLRVQKQIVWLQGRIPQIVDAVKAKLLGRLGELDCQLEPGRLEQEAALLAQKLDVAEEIERLQAHVEEAVRTLEKQEPIGRRLDFLLQEMNREANTIASKSAHIDSTGVSIELKVLIEQMREQVQNLE